MFSEFYAALKMLIRLSIYLFLLLSMTACGTMQMKKVARLPVELRESSGLVAESPTVFWSHNDSGDEPVLYKMDAKGTILKKVKVLNATNVDWEEIQLTQDGALYIGDFGNNSLSRRNLAIYKIPDFVKQARDSVVIAEKIAFHYEDQTAFPPIDAQKYVDAEAMIVAENAVFILAKDFYTKPYTGSSRIYQIPNQAGIHTARLVGTFKTDNSSKFKGAITSATVSPDGTIAILTYQKLWILRGGMPNGFWQQEGITFRFGWRQFAQREAIAFADSCTLYMTSEKEYKIGGNITRVNLCKYLKKRESKNKN